jgi:serine/threonine protein kinase
MIRGMGDSFNLIPGGEVTLYPPAGESALRFKVLEPIAAGANSLAYLAQGWDGVYVVLKGPRRAGVVDHDLRIEQLILEQLEHKNLIRYLGSNGAKSVGLVLGSERVFESPLEVMRRPEIRKHFPGDPGTYYYPLPLPIALRMALDLMRGLEYMHRNGFVHHDVKPQNFMIRVESQRRVQAPKRHVLLQEFLAGKAEGVLIDIGASRSVGYLAGLSEGREDPGAIAPQATPLFAPPEMLLPEDRGGRLLRHHHPSIDIYAAAMVIYSLISGHVAYDHLKGDTRQDFDYLNDVKREERRGRVSPFDHQAFSLIKGLGREADRLLRFLSKCAHSDPEARPSYHEGVRYFERLERGLKGGLGSQGGPHFGRPTPPPRP